MSIEQELVWLHLAIGPTFAPFSFSTAPTKRFFEGLLQQHLTAQRNGAPSGKEVPRNPVEPSVAKSMAGLREDQGRPEKGGRWGAAPF